MSLALDLIKPYPQPIKKEYHYDEFDIKTFRIKNRKGLKRN